MSNKQNVTIAILILIVLSIISVFAVQYLPFQSKDDGVFQVEAKVLSNYYRNSVPLKDVTFHHAFGPSIYYSIPYSFANTDNEDTNLKYCVMWNMIWTFIGLLFLQLSYFKINKNKHPYFILVFIFIIPLQVYYGLSLGGETLAFTGCCIYIYAIINLLERGKKIKEFLILIVGMLLMILARPNSGLILVLIPLVLFAFSYYKKAPSNKILNRKLYISIFSTVLILTSITFLIKKLPSNLNKDKQENLFLEVAHAGRFQYRSEEFDWRFWGDKQRINSEDFKNWRISNAELDSKIDSVNSYTKVYTDWLISDTKEHPLLILKQALIRLLSGNCLIINSIAGKNFSLGPLKGESGYLIILLIINFINLSIIILAILGIILLWKQNRLLILIVIPYIALVIFHIFVYIEPRYLFPARPVFILLASIYASHVLTALKSKMNNTQITS